MKIKLDRPIEYTSMASSKNTSISNKDIGDDNQRAKNLYVEFGDGSNRVEDVDTTPRIDRVESTNKVEKATNTDYSNLVKQRNEKSNQYRKELMTKNVFESSTKTDAKREQNKKELVEKMSSSNDNIKRVQQEFNDNKDAVTTKIHEQNDSQAQSEAKLRESKRQLLSEIQRTSESNNQIQVEMQQNLRELTSESLQERNVGETSNNSKDKEQKQVSLEERKAALVKKVIDNTSEDASIKQKLSQYKRELATANAKREQLSKLAQDNEVSLKKIEVDDVLVDTTSSDVVNDTTQVREVVTESDVEKTREELAELSGKEAAQNSQAQNTTNYSLIKSSKFKKVKIKVNPELQQVKPAKSKSSSSRKASSVKNNSGNVVDISSKVKTAIPTETYKSPNLTSFDISTMSISSNSTHSVSNVSDFSADIATVSSSSSNVSSSTSSTNSSDSSSNSQKNAIASKIAADASETTEIKQKLREYQAEVRKINSEISSLTDTAHSSNILSYKNSTEEDKIDYDYYNPMIEEITPEEIELVQFDNIIENEKDLAEVEVMMSAQEELNNVIKLLATEIKQDELLAKIAEQEQVIARNKILEKRESLIELAKQNNELLRTLNERLSIITKKVARSTVYAPTVVTQRNRMIA